MKTPERYLCYFNFCLALKQKYRTNTQYFQLTDPEERKRFEMSQMEIYDKYTLFGSQRYKIVFGQF